MNEKLKYDRKKIGKIYQQIDYNVKKESSTPWIFDTHPVNSGKYIGTAFLNVCCNEPLITLENPTNHGQEFEFTIDIFEMGLAILMSYRGADDQVYFTTNDFSAEIYNLVENVIPENYCQRDDHGEIIDEDTPISVMDDEYWKIEEAIKLLQPYCNKWRNIPKQPTKDDIKSFSSEVVQYHDSKKGTCVSDNSRYNETKKHDIGKYITSYFIHLGYNQGKYDVLVHITGELYDNGYRVNVETKTWHGWFECKLTKEYEFVSTDSLKKIVDDICKDFPEKVELHYFHDDDFKRCLTYFKHFEKFNSSSENKKVKTTINKVVVKPVKTDTNNKSNVKQTKRCPKCNSFIGKNGCKRCNQK